MIVRILRLLCRPGVIESLMALAILLTVILAFALARDTGVQ